jgi:hypothetical protein
MHDHEPIQTEIRRTRRRERLGEDARCLLCGCGNPEALTVATGKIRQGVLEVHHVVGRKNESDLTVILCLNCHRVVTETARLAGVSLTRPPTVLHRIVALLRGVSAFCADLGDSCFTSATTLDDFIARLDEHVPGWRDLEEKP